MAVEHKDTGFLLRTRYETGATASQLAEEIRKRFPVEFDVVSLPDRNIRPNPNIGRRINAITTEEHGVTVEVLEPAFKENSLRTVVRKGDRGFIVSTVPHYNYPAEETEVFEFAGYEQDVEGFQRAKMGGIVSGYTQIHRLYEHQEATEYHRAVIEELEERLTSGTVL